MQRNLSGWVAGGLIFGVMATVYAQDEVTLTTYYPSPRGVYNELRVGSSTFPSPNAKLHVVQPADDGTLAFRVDDDSPTDDTPFVITETGNVGVGDPTPVATFVVGSGDRFQVAGASGNITTAGDLALNGGDLTSTGAFTVTPAGGSNLNVALSAAGDFAVNTSQLYVDTSAGRVGIGVTGPTRTLDVNGTIRIRGGSPAAGKVLTSDGSGNATWEYPTYAP